MNRISWNANTAGNVVRCLLVMIGLALIVWCFSGDVRIAGGPGIGLIEGAVIIVGISNILVGLFLGQWVSSLLLLQISLGLTFVAAETTLRMTLSYRYFSPYKLEQRYLYDLIPGASREHRVSEPNGGANIYRVNSLGFRGEEFTRERNEKVRVAIYGDSFIHAEYTALESTLARQLQERLVGIAERPVEVINAGVAGYGPDQALRRIEDELPWLQPDVLVLAVFTGNDFGDLVRNKIYRVAPNATLLETDYSFSDEILLHAKLEEVEFIVRRIVRDAVAAISAKVSNEDPVVFDPEKHIEAGLQQHINEYQDFVVDKDDVIKMLRSDPYSADISLLPDSPSAQYKIALMTAVIGELSKVAKAADVPLLLVGIPHPMDVLNGSADSGRIDTDKYPDYDSERLTDSLQSIARQHGVEEINLLPYFREVDNPALLYLKGSDDHWNDAGQAYAADIIAAKIQSSGWLATGASFPRSAE